MDAYGLRNALALSVADVRVGGGAVTPNESDYAVADALLPLIRNAQAEALEKFAQSMPLVEGTTVPRDVRVHRQIFARAAAYRVGEGQDNG